MDCCGFPPLRFSSHAGLIASQTVTSLQSHTLHSRTLITNAKSKQSQQNFQFLVKTNLICCNFHSPTFDAPFGPLFLHFHCVFHALLPRCCSCGPQPHPAQGIATGYEPKCAGISVICGGIQTCKSPFVCRESHSEH